VDIHPVDHTVGSVAEALVRIQRRAYAVEAKLIEFDRIPNLSESVEDVQQLHLSITAASDDDEIVGFIGYTHEGTVVEIDRLAVDPDSFRRGIGRALLQSLHDAAPDAEFLVSTPARNAPAVALYTSIGYRIDYERVVAESLPIVGLRRSSNGRS